MKMRSLIYRLTGIFLFMSLIPLFLGVFGSMELRTAQIALMKNDSALQNLRGLLVSAGDSLAENAQIQETAGTVTAQIANAHEETAATLKEMGDSMIPKTFAISQMRQALAEASSAERALLLALNMRHLDESELKSIHTNQLASIMAAMNSIQAASEIYEKLLSGGDERLAWAALQEALGAWKENHADFMADIDNLRALVDDLVRGGPLFASSSRKAYDTAFVRGRTIRAKCEELLDDLNQTITHTVEDDVRRATQTQASSHALVQDLSRESKAATERTANLRTSITAVQTTTADAAEQAALALESITRRAWVMAAILVAAMIAFVLWGFFISWRIGIPIRKMADQMARIAKGDLTEDVPASDRARMDEIGQLARTIQDMILSNRAEISMANAMAAGDYTRPMPLRSEYDQLGRALGVMLQNSNNTLFEVSRAVERVGKGASAVQDASHSLSRGAQTSASALDEITATIHHVDSQAKDNASNAQQANSLAVASRDAAQRGYQAVTELVAAMGEIQQSGKKIASVAKLIDDIAFQTNLLALNAAVEAARAGRQGKGFSVVADEVRNLSGRSAKAAQETGAMVTAMTQRMEAGAQQAARTDNEFREIVDATSKVAQLFAEITGASNAQSVAMAQISRGLAQIDEVIQETTNNASRTATSAQALSQQADGLRSMVTRFHLMHDSHPAAPASPEDSPPAPSLLTEGMSRDPTKFLTFR